MRRNSGRKTVADVTAITALGRFLAGKIETPWTYMDRMHRVERICSVFSIGVRFPKLDVAGSIPVSRSIFSTT